MRDIRLRMLVGWGGGGTLISVCKGLIFTIVMVINFVSLAGAADWFVRPAGSGIAVKNGQSYATAWEGLNTVVWGESGVKAGDTLWVCGTFIPNSSAITVGASGSSDDERITIRGDYPDDPGIIYSTFSTLTPSSNWTHLGNGVYRTSIFSGNRGSYLYEKDGNNIRLSKKCDYFSSQREVYWGADRVNTINDTISISQSWSNGTKVIFAGTPPSPLIRNKDYYVVNSEEGSIQLSLTPFGDPIDFTSQGSYQILGRALSDSELGAFTTGFFWGDGPYSEHVYYKTVSGKAPRELYIYNSVGGNLLTINSQYYINIYNLTFYGGTTLTNSSYINIDNVKIHHSAWAMAIVQDCNYINVTNCEIDDSCEGIYAYTSVQTKVADNCIVANNRITNIVPYTWGSYNDQHAIAFQNGENNKVYNNYIETAATGTTVYVDSWFDTDCSFESYNNFVKDIYAVRIGIANWRSSESTLVDPGVNFASFTAVGKKIKNRTTGAVGTITSITTTLNTNDTVVVTLSGGSRNSWQQDDIWQTSGSGHGYALDFHGPVNGCVTVVKFYNNIVVNIDFGGVRASNALSLTTAKTSIYNNTFVNVGSGILIGGNSADYNVANLNFNNNIIKNVRDCGLGILLPRIFSLNCRPNGNSFIINNNDYYIESDPTLNGQWFRYYGSGSYINLNWSGWLPVIQANDPTNETRSIRANPQFLNTSGSYSLSADYKLTDNSPARSAGYAWEGIDRDFGGFAFNKTRPSMGAWSWRGKLGGISQPAKKGKVEDYRPTK